MLQVKLNQESGLWSDNGNQMKMNTLFELFSYMIKYLEKYNLYPSVLSSAKTLKL